MVEIGIEVAVASYCCCVVMMRSSIQSGFPLTFIHLDCSILVLQLKTDIMGSEKLLLGLTNP